MKNLFVPFEIAKKLKEKGFNEDCFGWYNSDYLTKVPIIRYIDGEICYNRNKFKEPFLNVIPVPIYQQVIDWFKNKHDLHIIEELDRTTEPKYCYEIWKYEHFGNWTLVSKRPEFFLHYTSNNNLNDAFVEALTLI